MVIFTSEIKANRVSPSYANKVHASLSITHFGNFWTHRWMGGFLEVGLRSKIKSSGHKYSKSNSIRILIKI